MKKQLLVLLFPVLFSQIKVDSTEIPFEPQPEIQYQLTYKEYSSDFRAIPTNPNVYQEINSYLDSDLTEVAGTIHPNDRLTIVGVAINQSQKLVFELDNQTYIPADQSLIYDDKITDYLPVAGDWWLEKDFQVFSSPIANQAKPVSTDLKAYQSVQISELVATPLGQFAHISGKGWISTEYLTQTDNRIKAVEELLHSKYQIDTISVYVKQLSTNQETGIHADKLMYSASIAKLPILYYVQEELDAGYINLTDKLQYTDQSITFPGSYATGGSGSLPKTPDQAYYSLEDLIQRTSKESDNVASNLLAYYITHQFDEDYQSTVYEATGQVWDMSSRMATARMAGLMMEAIYKQDGYVLESLLTTQFDNQRISKDIEVPVAHKIGDADDVKHDVAVVYTDSPFILSIFTDKSSYEMISQIANDIYGILK